MYVTTGNWTRDLPRARWVPTSVPRELVTAILQHWWSLFFRIEIPNLMSNPVVVKIAKKLSKTPAQILLKFIVQKDIAVIPKSTNPERLKKNIEVIQLIRIYSKPHTVNTYNINSILTIELLQYFRIPTVSIYWWCAGFIRIDVFVLKTQKFDQLAIFPLASQYFSTTSFHSFES